MGTSFRADRERSFELVSAARLMWFGGPYGDIVTGLRSAVLTGAGLVVLTGEVGTGKTIVANTLGELVRANGVLVAHVAQPSRDLGEFFQVVGQAYGWPGVESETFLQAAEGFLTDLHARDVRALLILEEAQGLGQQVLAELAQLVTLARRLSGDTGSPLTLLLVGQDDLAKRLNSLENETLNALVAVRYRLNSLTAADVRLYVEQQLVAAGLAADLFTPAALERIAHASGGIPRVINLLCHRALADAMRDSATKIGPATVDAVAARLISARGAATRDALTAWGTAMGRAVSTAVRGEARLARIGAIAAVLALTVLAGYLAHGVSIRTAFAQHTPTTLAPIKTEPRPPDQSSSSPLRGPDIVPSPTVPARAVEPSASASDSASPTTTSAPNIAPVAPTQWVPVTTAALERPRTRPGSSRTTAPPPHPAPAHQPPPLEPASPVRHDQGPDARSVIDWLLREASR